MAGRPRNLYDARKYEYRYTIGVCKRDEVPEPRDPKPGEAASFIYGERRALINAHQLMPPSGCFSYAMRENVSNGRCELIYKRYSGKPLPCVTKRNAELIRTCRPPRQLPKSDSDSNRVILWKLDKGGTRSPVALRKRLGNAGFSRHDKPFDIQRDSLPS